jgi:hypothetical protein
MAVAEQTFAVDVSFESNLRVPDRHRVTNPGPQAATGSASETLMESSRLLILETCVVVDWRRVGATCYAGARSCGEIR